MTEDPCQSGDEFCAIRRSVVAPLQARSEELARLIHEEVQSSVPDVFAAQDSGYQAALKQTVAAIVQYTLQGLLAGPGYCAPVPPAACDQARLAAQAGVSVTVVLRRYFAGHRLLEAIITHEAERLSVAHNGPAMMQLRTSLHGVLEHLITAVEREHARATRELPDTLERRRAALARRLLTEDLGHEAVAALGYDIYSAWHICAVAGSPRAAEALVCLKDQTEHKVILMAGDDGSLCMWLTAVGPLSPADLARVLASAVRRDTPLAVGEPGNGLAGWRESHREAELALPIARRLGRVTRCVDVLPVAAAASNEAILRTYETRFLAPLDSLPKQGGMTRRVLNAYFKHQRNLAAAEHGIDVTRRTIENHLKLARGALGDSVNMTGLEVALQLEELGFIAHAPTSGRSGDSVS